MKALDKLDACPPFFAYALMLVRNASRRRPLTMDDMCKVSGLPKRTLARVSQKQNWDGVKVGVMRSFLKACQVDPWSMKKYMKLLRQYHGGRLPGLNRLQWESFNTRCATLSEKK